MLEKYNLEEIERNIELEEDIYRLVILIIESGFYYDSNNKFVITKSRIQILEEINEKLDEYCNLKGIDKKIAIEIAKKTIKNNNELRFNPTERKRAMNLLGIEDDNEQR